MPDPVLLLLVGFLLLVIRLLHLASKASPPNLYYNNSLFNRTILEKCPLLQEHYIPPLLWGKSGHLQTITYGKMGRIDSPFPCGKRHIVVMADGATVTFDVFEPTATHSSGDDFTLLMCPGIANSSESLYICTCVHFAQEKGYRVAVLNHLGALRDVPLTAPRIFTYGGTEEFGTMVDYCLEMYPQTQGIGVGFSMGGNILLKYIGENPANNNKLLCAISCCQGYDINKLLVPGALAVLMSWEHVRRLYIWAMTLNVQKIYRHHYDILFGANATSHSYDEDVIFSSTSLLEIDKEYSARRAGFGSVEEYYHQSSSSKYMHNIHIPVFILNSLDDPLVHNDLHIIPKEFAMSRDNVVFATTRHGGHLGYFEGGMFKPETLTWLDKIVLQYADAVVSTTRKTASGEGTASM